MKEDGDEPSCCGICCGGVGGYPAAGKEEENDITCGEWEILFL